ncbi:MAG: DUF805 domain-containing protein [Tidjanibacter sp.]|nr:DUF805 domain-containing protein [Tidjanibacter sp.]
MNSFEYFKKCFRQYADFKGRARRAEYWYFVLYTWLISIAVSLVDMLTLGVGEDGMGLLGAIFSLVIFIPSLAASVRRMHDTGRSGWVLLLSFIPVIGWIFVIVYSCQDSQPGSNKWGANPKEIEA